MVEPAQPMTVTPKAPINWPAAILLTVTPIAAVTLVPWYGLTHGFSVAAWASFLGLWALNGMSITAGYHRLWAHRAYEAHPLVRFVLLVGGTMAVQNSVLVWCAGHRTHHRHVDHVDLDPYSAKRGFWYSHIGWMLRNYPSGNADFTNVPDLQKDPMLQFQHKHYLLLILLTNFALPAVIGWAVGDFWGVMLLGGLLRLVVSHHMTFFINSLCHMWGKRPYTDENTARDNFWLALFTWGEGYHNYHHIFQYDYRNGIKWWHYDPTKWLIGGLNKLRLTSKLRRVPDFQLKKAEVEMQLKRAAAYLETQAQPASQLEQWRTRLNQEYTTFSHTLNEWATLKEQSIELKKEAFAQRLHEADAFLKHEFQALEQKMQAQHTRLATLLTRLRQSVHS